MDILIFIYNIVLLMLYAAISTLAFTYFIKNRSPLFLAVGFLFLVNICDNTIIYMTEYIEWFSGKYNTQFMTIPAFKTIILLAYSASILFICNYILKRKSTFLQYISLLALGLLLMFTPMMANSAYKVWLYYLPCQIFQIWLSLDGLHTLKQNPERYDNFRYKIFSTILKITLIFSVLILIEDTIVIFRYDVYSNLLIRIHNRNICEDILSIIYCFYFIRYFVHLFAPKEIIQSAIVSQSDTKDETAAVLTRSFALEPSPIDTICNVYNLTAREREIFALLINNKTNQDICDELLISIGTVKTHVHNIFSKFGVSKRNQILRMYQEFYKEDNHKTSKNYLEHNSDS